MQSFGGGIRLVRRQATNCSKNFDFSSAKGRLISGDSIFGKLNSSSARNEVRDAKFVGSSFHSSNGLDYASPRRKLTSYSKLQLTQPSINMDLLTSSGNGRHLVSLLYRAHKPDPCHQSVAMQTLSIRCISTMNNSSNSTEQDASPSVSGSASRIKFKRLDKTARHIMQILDKEAVDEVKQQREIPDIKPGHIIQLKVEVPENKRRVSILKGIVIARRNAGLNTTFRLRRLVAGVGVESLFPLYSPNIKEIKILDKKKVRRAKLYYLRDRMNPLKK